MFDSHAHLAFDQFDLDREEVIARAKEAGCQGWIEIGTDIEGSRKAIELAGQHSGQNLKVGATVGVHPSEAEGLGKEQWEQLRDLARREKVVAVGEVGVDLYRGGSLQKQLEALQQFIDLAGENGLPVVFHVRSGEKVDAHDEVIKLLSSYGVGRRPKGVMHSFSGTWRQAQRYLELGMYLSFTGVVTFKNAREMAEVARRVPLERMLVETDCPFLAPEPHRGSRNELAYVKLVADEIAALKGLKRDEVARVTEKNALRLFGLDR